jgi:hypothetical protein
MHWGDFWESEAVEGMSNEAALLYLWLLSRQWRNESLPSDREALLRAIPTRFAASFDESWSQIQHKFVLCRDGRLRNPTCSEYLVEAQKRAKSYAQRGGKGGRASAASRGSTSASTSAQAELQPQLKHKSTSERRGEESS